LAHRNSSPVPSCFLALTIALVGCSSSGSPGTLGTGGSPAEVCVPGTSTACTCTNGKSGAQVCSPNGTGYEVCTCSGTEDTGGSVGSGGSGLGAGGSGTTGSGGVTGAAGRASTGTGGIPVDAGSPPVDAGKPSDAGISPPTSTNYTGRWVSVQVVDAIIAPSKADGTAWDGTVMIPDEVLTQVGDALAGGDPVGGVLAVLAGPTLNDAIDSLDKPDAFGTAQATVFGTIGEAYWLAQEGDAIQDSYTPIWPYGWYYKNVPIDSDVRISVQLWDSDLIDDDPIGVAQINSSDFKAALAAQEKFYVRVDDQTDGQLLFIGISVTQQTGEL